MEMSIHAWRACSTGHLIAFMQVPPFKKALMEAMPYIDFLFGNETEARAFAESEGWTTTDVAEIALKVGCWPPKAASGQAVNV